MCTYMARKERHPPSNPVEPEERHYLTTFGLRDRFSRKCNTISWLYVNRVVNGKLEGRDEPATTGGARVVLGVCVWHTLVHHPSHGWHGAP